ncbi:MAG: argininosuccinate synthase [Fulvivirga sp.]|nr:argininosuccinate synthase [Fulvivirga sp.]
MNKSKVVLAFSGGLDTSYCVKYLSQEKKFAVYSAVVNTGGFSQAELDEIEKRAKLLGVDDHVCLEQTTEFYNHVVKYLIYGNVLKNSTYPLSVSAERVYQAIALAEYAREIGANYIAHGSTGAGNDQVRFDLIFSLIAPEIEILTPIRDQKLSREEEIDYLAQYGFHIDWQKAKYSVNKGLWGTSVGGAETLTSDQPLPESAFPTQLSANQPLQITLSFKKGEVCALNGNHSEPVEIIQALEKTAGKYAIGRDIHVGDTIIGIKGRVGFEAAAASIIIKAHQTLEKHTLSKWQMHWKEQLGNWYGMFIHEAQYFEPVMRNIESFLESTQQYVTGKVMICLHPYRFVIQGIASKHDLMNPDFGAYGEMNNHWTADDVKGFTRLLGNQMQIFKKVNSSI